MSREYEDTEAAEEDDGETDAMKSEGDLKETETEQREAETVDGKVGEEDYLQEKRMKKETEASSIPLVGGEEGHENDTELNDQLATWKALLQKPWKKN